MKPGARRVRAKRAKVVRCNLTIPKNVMDLMERLDHHGVDVNLSRIATKAFEDAATQLLDRLGDPIEECVNCAGTGYCARSKNEGAVRAPSPS